MALVVNMQCMRRFGEWLQLVERVRGEEVGAPVQTPDSDKPPV